MVPVFMPLELYWLRRLARISSEYWPGTVVQSLSDSVKLWVVPLVYLTVNVWSVWSEPTAVAKIVRSV